MSGRSPLDRAIDFAFGVPIAATAFAREATRLALRSVVSTAAPHPSTDPGGGEERTTERPVRRAATGSTVEGFADDATADSSVVAVDSVLVGYDSLGAREILALIEDLDEATLALVEEYEQRTRGRRTVLVRIAALRQSGSA